MAMLQYQMQQMQMQLQSMQTQGYDAAQGAQSQQQQGNIPPNQSKKCLDGRCLKVQVTKSFVSHLYGYLKRLVRKT